MSAVIESVKLITDSEKHLDPSVLPQLLSRPAVINELVSQKLEPRVPLTTPCGPVHWGTCHSGLLVTLMKLILGLHAFQRMFRALCYREVDFIYNNTTWKGGILFFAKHKSDLLIAAIQVIDFSVLVFLHTQLTYLKKSHIITVYTVLKGRVLGKPDCFF